MACAYLKETGVNWYDSGGSFEELVLDMPNRTRGLEINSCYINKETEFAEGQEFDELINGVDDPLKRKILHLSSEGPFFGAPRITITRNVRNWSKSAVTILERNSIRMEATAAQHAIRVVF